MFRPARRVTPAALLAACAATATAFSVPTLAAPAFAGGDPVRPPRPAPANLRVENLSPALEATLAAWYAATRDVEKLEGTHTEIRTVKSFAVEYHRAGKFYYQSPDHGRIELVPADVEGKAPQTRPGEPYAVVPGQPELWICDGVRVTSQDRAAKEAQIIELPPDQRGENIMNGPLPFLLGMPPATVKARFQLRFFPGSEPTGDVRAWLKDPASKVVLELLPRRQQDSKNWRKAQVMLSKPDFLPVAVKLFAPGGDMEIVYNFRGIKKNRAAIFSVFLGDPFKPDLKGYAIVRGNGGPAGQAPPAAAAAGGKPPQRVPAVTTMPYKMATAVLRERGYEVNLARGPETDKKALVGKVAAQQYKPGAELPAGKTVGLKVYRAAPSIR